MNKSEEKKPKNHKSQAEHAFLSGMLPQLVSFQTLLWMKMLIAISSGKYRNSSFLTYY